LLGGEAGSGRGLGATVKQSIDRHSPLGFYNYAASYHVAADLICDQGLKATHPEAPPMFLYYHAIELYLKSFLLFHGVSVKCLQGIGHDYKRLLSRASEHGLVLGELEKEVMSILDGDNWSRSRYLEIGILRGPSLYALSETSKSLRQEVAKVLREAGQPVRMPSHKKVRRAFIETGN
jgi:HEPN domain-containing protein